MLKRDLIFNGIEFPIAVPIQSDLKWKAYRFTYEYDFVYRDRGFVGLVLEAKYTDVTATLTNALDLEFVHARAPIPAVGLIGRGYVAPNIAITGEFTFFKLPEIQGTSGSYSTSICTAPSTSPTTSACRAATDRSTSSTRSTTTTGTCSSRASYFGGVVRF